jgi:hypothetical protein
MINNFSDFVGMTITGTRLADNELHLTFSNGDVYKLYHKQDCCEDVYLYDVIGDFSDLIGFPIMKAEEVSSCKTPDGIDAGYMDDSFTWTFYHIVTFMGAVTLRWLGESNGYYSESVDIAYLKDGKWHMV